VELGLLRAFISEYGYPSAISILFFIVLWRRQLKMDALSDQREARYFAREEKYRDIITNHMKSCTETGNKLVTALTRHMDTLEHASIRLQDNHEHIKDSLTVLSTRIEHIERQLTA